MTDQIPTTNDKDSDELWETLARYLSGESDAAEAAWVRRWLSADPQRAELLTEMDAAVQRHPRTRSSDVDVEAALAQVHDRMRSHTPAAGIRVIRPPARARQRWYTSNALRAAAALALVLGAGLMWRVTRPDHVPGTTALTWETAVGEIDSLRLPDGSGVVLAPDSRLSVPPDFNVSGRSVTLDGEAWFDVTSDAVRPFSVRTVTGTTVVALGTAFVVRTGTDGAVRVTVTAGEVRVGPGPIAADGVTLRAGDRADVTAGADPVVEPGAVSDADVAWLQGRLVFDNAPVTRVTEDMYRWYGIRLTWSDPALGARRVSASFEGESAEEVLDVVAAVLGVQVEIEGTYAVLHPRSGSP